MDLEEIRVLVAIADHGSVLGAANALRLPRSSVRRRLGELEARVGVALILRTNEGASLTEAGRLLAEQGKRLLSDADALLGQIRDIGTGPRGTLRIALPSGAPPDLLVMAFGALRARLPNVRFEARTSDAPDFSIDEADLVAQFGDKPLSGEWSAPIQVRIRAWLIASAGFLERNGPVGDLDTLGQCPIMTWRSPDYDPAILPLRAGGGFVVSTSVVSSDIHMLRQFARAGHGVAMVPDALLPEPEGPDGPLVPILPDVVGRDLSLRVLVPKRVERIPKIREVLDELQMVVNLLGIGAA